MASAHRSGAMLAIAGALIILAAVIAGLFAVGGPGAARSARLDQLTYASLVKTANAAQCAFLAKGAAAANIKEAREIAESVSEVIRYSVCDRLRPATANEATEADQRIAYRVLNDSHVELCATFLLTFDPATDAASLAPAPSFRELLESKPAGRQCYGLNLGRLVFYRTLAHVADAARLARCAYFVSGDVQPSLSAAIDALKGDRRRRALASCGWTEEFDPSTDTNLQYERLAADRVRLCATFSPHTLDPKDASFRAVTANPDFTFPELNDADAELGHRCFDIKVSIERDPTWGHPPP